MAEKKITKRENFESIKAFLIENGKDELAKVMEHEIELFARKNSKSATQTPAQKDALAVSEIIKDILAEVTEGNGMTVSALLKDKRIKSYVKANGDSVSSQMITAILSKSADFKRTMEKKTAYFSLNYGIEGEGEVEGE